MGSRGMGAATRGGGAVMGTGAKREGYKDGGSVGDSRVHPRAGTQGLAKRGYKAGGAVMDKDDHPDRIKKANGGLAMSPGAGMQASGALQNQGAIIGAKKRKKTTRLGMLKAPSTPMPAPTTIAGARGGGNTGGI